MDFLSTPLGSDSLEEQPPAPMDWQSVSAPISSQPKPTNWLDVPKPSLADSATSVASKATDSSAFDDLDLDAVEQIESSGNNFAVSHKILADGTKVPVAFGPFQFTKETAADRGLDNPFDKTQARPAAQKYLDENYGKFGSKDLALAAYNMGPSKVNALVDKYGKAAIDHLPTDVQQYITNFKAARATLAQAQPQIPDWQSVPKPDQSPSALPVMDSVVTPTTPSPTEQPTNPLSYIGSDSLGIQPTGSQIPDWQSIQPSQPPLFTFGNTYQLGKDLLFHTQESPLTKAAGGVTSSLISGMAGFGAELGKVASYANPQVALTSPKLTPAQVETIGNRVSTFVNDYLTKTNPVLTTPEAQRGSQALGTAMGYINAPTDWIGNTISKSGFQETGQWIKLVGPLITQSVLGGALHFALPKYSEVFLKNKTDATVSAMQRGTGISVDRTVKNADGTGMTVPSMTVDEMTKAPEKDYGPAPVQGELDLTGQQKLFGDESLPVPPQLATSTLPYTIPSEAEKIASKNPVQGALTFSPRTDAGISVLSDIEKSTVPPTPAEELPVPTTSADTSNLRPGDRLLPDQRSLAFAPERELPQETVPKEESPGIISPAQQEILDLSKSENMYLSTGDVKVGDSVRLETGEWGVVTGKAATGSRWTVQIGDTTRDVPSAGITYRLSRGPNSPLGRTTAMLKASDEIAKRERPEIQNRPFNNKQKGAISTEGMGKLVENIRGLTSGLKAKLGPKDKSTVFYTPEETTALAFRLYDGSFDSTDFRQKLTDEVARNVGLPPGLPDAAESIWQHFESGNVPKVDPMDALTNLQQREANFASSYPVFMQRLLKATGLTNKDVFTAREFALPSEYAGRYNWNNAATRVIKWAVDSIRETNTLANYRIAKYLEFSKPFFDLKRSNRLNVMGAFHDWDQGGKFHQNLLNSKLQYPSLDMLKKGGLSDAEVAAYDAMAKGYQGLFEFFRNTEQLPGYMPHMWHGSYKIQVFSRSGQLVAVDRSITRFGAKAAQEEWQKKGYNTSSIEDPATTNSSEMLRDLMAATTVFKNVKGLDPAARARIEAITQRLAAGKTYETMERHGIKGFTGTDGVLPESGNGIYRNLANRFANNKMMGIYPRYVNDIIAGWRNDQVVRNVMTPFGADHYWDGHTNLRKTMEGIIQKATGLSRTEMDAIDKTMHQMLIQMGLPTDIPRRLVSALNATARFKTINSFNLGFAGKHLAFSLFTFPSLIKTHMDLLNAGEKTGNIYDAMTKLVTSNVPGSGKLYDGVAQAMRGRYVKDGLETNMYEGVTTSGNQAVDFLKHGMLNLAVQHSRRVTFDAHFAYYREIMSPEQAYQAAKKATNRVMQSFDPLDTPGIFTEGNVGRLFRPFNQIVSYNIGRYLDAYESVKDAIKTGNPIKIGRSLAVPAALFTTYYYTGGLQSMLPRDSWNLVADWLNKEAGTSIPSLETFLKNHDFNDTQIIGALSRAVGTDVSTTFEGVDPTSMLGSASLEMGSVLAQLIFHEALYFIRGVDDPTVRRALLLKLVPPGVASEIKYEQAKGTSGVIQNTKLRPTYIQSDLEHYHDVIMGSKTFGEAEKELSENVMRNKIATSAASRKYYSNILIEKLMGNDTGSLNFNEIYRKAMGSDIGFNPSAPELAEQLKETITTRNQTAAMNYLREIAKATNPILKAKMIRDYKYLFGSE